MLSKMQASLSKNPIVLQYADSLKYVATGEGRYVNVLKRSKRVKDDSNK